jgi:curli biogenesis system outer membrane secretion channel CsgG
MNAAHSWIEEIIMNIEFKSICLFCFFIILQSCATLQKPDVEVVKENKPQISKVLEEPSQRFLKRKVAIGRFSNETKYGQSFFVDENKDVIGKQAMDILSAKLAATDKFILLERADIDKINKELNSGNLTSSNIPADYLILGSVSEFGREDVSDVGIFSRVKKQKAYAKVYIRLVDIYTGQVIYSAEGAGEAFSEAGSMMGVGARAGYDSSLNDKAISAAISKVVNHVIETLLDKPWRSYILAKKNGNYVIAGGTLQGIKKDDVFGVYMRGEKIKNPQTEMFIELPGQLIGEIRIDKILGNGANNEISICSVVSGEIPNDKFSELYIQEIEKK